MPSYPSTDGIPIQFCQRCRAILSPNTPQCMNCGFSQPSAQKTNEGNSFPPRMTTNPLTPYPPANIPSRPGPGYNPLTPYPSNIDNIPGKSAAPNVPMQGMQPPFAPSTPPMQGLRPPSTPSMPPIPPTQGLRPPSTPSIQPGSNQNVSGQSMYPGNTMGTSFPQGPFPSTSFPQQPFNLPQNSRPPFNPSQVPQHPFQATPFGPGTHANIQGQRPPFFQPEPPVPPQRRRSKWKVVLGMIILLVVLVGGGLAGYIFLLQPSNTQPTANISIPTPTQPPVFADSFQNNAKGWDLQSENSLFSMAIGQGALTLEDDHNKLLPLAVPGTDDKPLSNFMLTFNAQLSRGDPGNGYGVNIRGKVDQNGVLSACYRIEFYGDGTYAVFKLDTNAMGTITLTHPVNYTSNTAIHRRGSVNHLSIVAKGSSFTLSANGQILKNFSDTSYNSGSIDFFVSNLPGRAPGAQAKFSQVALYTI